jgi:chemotaxis protein CheD
MTGLQVVGIADCAVTSNANDTLVTYALGSCIALTVYDPVTRVAGLVHYLLPDIKLDSARGEKNPYLCASTAIPLLFQRAYQAGADKRRLVVRIIGGAQVMDDNGIFQIGKRNALAARQILWKAGVLIQGEETGGSVSRTVRLEVQTGKVWVREGAGIGKEMVARASSSKGLM